MASSYGSSIHIGGAAFSWQMPYKFFYKFLKTKEKDEHVLGPIFVCGNLAWRLEWLPHGQVGDMDDPDNYGLFLRLDSLPGDIESVNARFTISSPCGHYHTDEGSVFSRYNEPMSFGRGNFGKISELTEWIDAMEETRRLPSPIPSPSRGGSSTTTSAVNTGGSGTTNNLLTVFEVSVSINAIHRMYGVSPASAPASRPSHHQHHQSGSGFYPSSVFGFGGRDRDRERPSRHHHNRERERDRDRFDRFERFGGFGDRNDRDRDRPPNEPERAPPESLDDIDVDGIRSVLRRHRLEKFLNEVIDLGVEVPTDMEFLQRDDLKRIGCNVVQLRKFGALLAEFKQQALRDDKEMNSNSELAVVDVGQNQQQQQPANGMSDSDLAAFSAAVDRALMTVEAGRLNEEDPDDLYGA